TRKTVTPYSSIPLPTVPRIDNDIKLDFKDVLIRPKRSTLRSRSQVSLELTHTFRNSKMTWTGVPLMAANMDTVGTFDIAKALNDFKIITCMHKHYTAEEWFSFAESHVDCLGNMAVSAGVSEKDLSKTAKILDRLSDKIPFICLDVANGYSEVFVDCVRKVREMHPTQAIIAGNVVTGEMVEELLLSGADIIKVRVWTAGSIVCA
ncbi:unnamed protein product, partial [Discosporangium mesarthrocarpum]